MKKFYFSGIFAAAFVATTAFMLASCSQDDEYYEDGLFTRADEMMTRSGGESGGNVPIIPSEPDTIVQPELPLHFFVYHEFEDEEVVCYAHSAGYTMTGKVFVSGVIYKDSLADYYWGKITNAYSDIVIAGSLSVDITNITSRSAALSANFTAIGLGFMGQKTITYPLHDNN